VIRPDRPVLSPGSRVVRQVEDGATRYVVRAGATGKYLRVGEPEAALLSLMDGTRTLEEIRTSFVARTKEVLDLADIAGFLHRMRKDQVVEPTAEGRNLLLVEKARQVRKERMFAGKMGSLFFMRVKLLDPDVLLTRVERWVRWIFTPAFLVFAALLVLAAAATIWVNSEEILGRVKNFLLISAGSGVGLLGIWATALFIVCLHETGHGVACKHWGGEVHEMGFLLMFFQPCFYCNVNDAWTFESRAAKLWVTAAGGVVEVLLGSAAVLVWAATEPGSAIHGVCYLVFMISLSGTLLFNLNPLIKLDGYYLLADLLRIENLRDRSIAQLSRLFKTKVLGKTVPPVATTLREAWILSAYAVASSLYQALLVTGILVLILGSVSGGEGPGILTLLLLGFVAWMILKRPLGAAKEALMQVADGQVKRHGTRGALLRAGAGAAVLVGLSFLVPWRVTSDAAATARPCRVAEVRSPLEGIVGEVLVADGDRVKAGDPLLRLEVPVQEALAMQARGFAEKKRREALERRSKGDAANAEAMEKDAEAAEIRAAGLEKRLASAVVPSPMDGWVLTRRPGDLRNSPVKRDASLLRVGDCSRIRFHAVMDARRVGPVSVGMEATVRLRSFPGEPFAAKVVSVSRQPLDAKDDRLQEATGPHWEVVVEAHNPGLRVRPGMTGETRVLLERTSLAGAVARGFRSTVRSDLLK
jgi:putative peptide zinc metalloprotease protein